MDRRAQFRGRLDLSEQSFQPHTVFSLASLRRLPHAPCPALRILRHQACAATLATSLPPLSVTGTDNQPRGNGMQRLVADVARWPIANRSVRRRIKLRACQNTTAGSAHDQDLANNRS
jgi:hypothetical protein